MTSPCTLYKQLTQYLNGEETESWDCLLDSADGSTLVAVNDLNLLMHAVSGETTLSAPGMAVADNKVVIPDPTQAIFGETKQEGNRRLASVVGMFLWSELRAGQRL